MKSCVLAVGTEITDGQIINRNASWLSAKVKALGARSVLHLAVPDDRARILAALFQAESEAEIIFVTGGLGPTSDDFTRELVAEWAGLELRFSDQAWSLVTERLTSRGYPVQEFQKQQCFFPEGSRLLWNAQGTAHAFALEVRGKRIFVLPGPPREIEAVWRDHLEGLLREALAGSDPVVTRSWDLLGLGESQVAALVEPLVASRGLEIGYRVHLPYVEFKLSAPRSKTAILDEARGAVEAALSPWIQLRDGADAADELARLLSTVSSIHLEDRVTGSFLLQRLGTPLRDVWARGSWTVTAREAAPAPGTELHLWLRPVDEHEVRIGWSWRSRCHESRHETSQRSPLMSERRKQHFAELAILIWKKGLADVSS